MFKDINRFVNWVRRRNPTAYTWKSYTYDLHQFAEIIGDKQPADLTLFDIDDYLIKLADRGLKPNTINRRIAAVTSFYRFLAQEQPELESPVLPYRHTVRAPKKLPRSASQADVEQLFAVIDNVRDQAIFLLMLRCGLRVSEVAKINLKDIYFDEDPHRLLVHGKNSKERPVYLSDQAAVVLKAHLKVRPESESEAVFLTYQEQRIGVRGIQKRIQKYGRLSAVHLTAHQLRHNFANDLVLADVPVTSIQHLMGHAWVATTELYLSANNAKVKQDYHIASQKTGGWL
jgi:site-specific recombinase XerD